MKLPTLFNPSNDMALAANVCQYFPPRHIRQMETDLASLARLWDEGPWGWSLAAKQYYRSLGIPQTELPTDEWLNRVRQLSSREFAVAYYQQLTDSLKEENTLLPCQARFLSSPSALNLLKSLSPLPLIFKSPWSSSGRGNIVVDAFPVSYSTEQRILATLRRQGGIVVEPFYRDKSLDFAMEFHCGHQGVRFLGYSVFQTDEMGHYGGNYVESQQSLLRRIDLPDALLRSLIDHHLRALSVLDYRGPVGIDMMRLADGRVHPCVELNFRRTMGWLALVLFDKGMTSDQLLAGDPQHGFSASITDGRLDIICRP
ncbi:MAG: hypothetical protein IJ064_02540 [Bacteroidaceae bacterium]|nr:hypothetical protein [Bacteroidaceae bacterium]